MQTAFRSEEQFTQAEFFDWLQEQPSSDINHYELLGGRIVMTPPAGFPHGAIEASLCQALGQHIRSRELGIVNGSSAGYDLPSGDTVEPNVSFISPATLAAGPAPEIGKFYKLVPDLVVEILSPATSARDGSEKKAIYERNGVDEYWIVDPRSRNVTVFHLEAGKYGAPTIIHAGSLTSRVLPGLSLQLEDLFAGL